MEFKQEKIEISGHEFYTITVNLPKTTFVLVGNDIGFIMCGALDVGIYDTPKLIERQVVCAKVVGVKTIEDLLNGAIKESTLQAQKMGIVEGTSVKDALLLLV